MDLEMINTNWGDRISYHSFFSRWINIKNAKNRVEGELNEWLKELWEALSKNDFLPKNIQQIPNEVLLPSKYLITIRKDSNNTIHKDSNNTVHKDINNTVHKDSNNTIIENKSGFVLGDSQSSWIQAKILENKRLTSPDWEQDVREICFEGNNDLKYEVGDVVQVLPQNLNGSATKILSRLNFDPELVVEKIELRDKDEQDVDNSQYCDIPFPIRLHDLLHNYFDLSRAPRRYFFEILSHFATAEHEVEKLKFFSSSEGQEELNWYSIRERRPPLEVLEEFHSIKNIELEYLFDLLPRINARSFSISSSFCYNPKRISITVAVVKYKTPLKRTRFGLCSNYLADLNPDSLVTIKIRNLKSQLNDILKQQQYPLILIGPGTGCALFHALVEERMCKKQTQPSLHFFFGCRLKEKDCLYEMFWMNALSQQILTFFEIAFSRQNGPTNPKVYVQHLIAKHSNQIWRLINEQSAAIVVSG